MNQSRKALCLIIWVVFFYVLSGSSLATAEPTSVGDQKTDLINTKTAYDKLKQDYKKIDNELKMNEQRLKKLTAELQLQQTTLDVLSAENQKLRESERTTFFIYGVGAILLGVALTLAIPRLRPKRRYSEWR